jgi:hypothetical protein
MAFNHDRQSKLHEGTVSRSRRQRSDLRGIFRELAQAAMEGIRIPGDKLETRLTDDLCETPQYWQRPQRRPASFVP